MTINNIDGGEVAEESIHAIEQNKNFVQLRGEEKADRGAQRPLPTSLERFSGIRSVGHVSGWFSPRWIPIYIW